MAEYATSGTILNQLADGVGGGNAVITLGPQAIKDMEALGVKVKADAQGAYRTTGAEIKAAIEAAVKSEPEPVSAPKPKPKPCKWCLKLGSEQSWEIQGFSSLVRV